MPVDACAGRTQSLRRVARGSLMARRSLSRRDLLRHHASAMHHHLLCAATLGALALVSSPNAQVTTGQHDFGGPGSRGCQGTSDPALLSDGSPATGRIDYSYDAATARLRVTVTNTTPVSATVPNPLITTVWFNVPRRAVTDVQFVSQSVGSPAFAMVFDPDIVHMPTPAKAACFGDFSIRLDTGGLADGGIAAAGASLFAPGAGPVAAGPVTFELQLTVDGVIDAHSIERSFSLNGPVQTLGGVLGFAGAGQGGTGAGEIGHAFACETAMYVVGEPRRGNDIEFVVTGGECCHICIWASLDPGPTMIAGRTVDIGFPLLGVFDFGEVGRPNEFSVPLSIPNDPRLANLSIHFVNVTFQNGHQQSTLNVSERFTLTIR